MQILMYVPEIDVFEGPARLTSDTNVWVSL